MLRVSELKRLQELQRIKLRERSELIKNVWFFRILRSCSLVTEMFNSAGDGKENGPDCTFLTGIKFILRPSNAFYCRIIPNLYCVIIEKRTYRQLELFYRDLRSNETQIAKQYSEMASHNGGRSLFPLIYIKI